jgi:hypothetical protein
LPGIVHGVVVQMTTERPQVTERALSLRLEGHLRVLVEEQPAERSHRKLHPDRVALVVVILDLGLRQRRALDHAPHHRLRAAIELADMANFSSSPAMRDSAWKFIVV